MTLNTKLELHSHEPPASAPMSARTTRAARLLRALRRLPRAVRLWRLYWLRAALRLAPTETQRLFALTIVIGVLCGLAAVAFHLAIELAEHALIERAMMAPGTSWILWT